MPAHSHTVNVVTTEGKPEFTLQIVCLLIQKALDKEYSDAASNTTITRNDRV